FKITNQDIDYLNERCQNLPVKMRDYRSFMSPVCKIRVCSKCNIIKPDRAHHCDMCQWYILFFYCKYFLFGSMFTDHKSIKKPYSEFGKNVTLFDLGCKQNFIEVFGIKKRYWFLPVFTSLGNGIEFPIQVQNQNVSKAKIDEHHKITIESDNTRYAELNN
ncbi:hypothetical protein A3Q56_03996, partial [Intoshia linei]